MKNLATKTVKKVAKKVVKAELKEACKVSKTIGWGLVITGNVLIAVSETDKFVEAFKELKK